MKNEKDVQHDYSNKSRLDLQIVPHKKTRMPNEGSNEEQEKEYRHFLLHVIIYAPN